VSFVVLILFVIMVWGFVVKMVKQKACRKCRKIYSGTKCPNCGSEESSDVYKGKVVVLRSEDSEIAKNLKIGKNGEFAVKT
jgi:DNA-directed RNA polymerase subunit E"